MKNRYILVIVAFILFVGILSGCSAIANRPSRQYDLELLAEDIIASEVFSDILTNVSAEIAAGLYCYDAEDVTESYLLCSTGATTEEIGLFKCRNADAASRVLEKAETRIKAQNATYEAYAPAEIPKLKDAIVIKNGNYVFYIVSLDSKIARQILNSAESK